MPGSGLPPLPFSLPPLSALIGTSVAERARGFLAGSVVGSFLRISLQPCRTFRADRIAWKYADVLDESARFLAGLPRSFYGTLFVGSLDFGCQRCFDRVVHPRGSLSFAVVGKTG